MNMVLVLSEFIVEASLKREPCVQLFKGPLPIQKSCVRLKIFCNREKIGLAYEKIVVIWREKKLIKNWANVEAPFYGLKAQ